MYHAIDDSINSEAEIIDFINKNMSTLHISLPLLSKNFGKGGPIFKKNQEWKPRGGGGNKKLLRIWDFLTYIFSLLAIIVTDTAFVV